MIYPVSKPELIGNEEKYLLDCIKTGWISSNGSYVEKFEKEFAKWNGMDYGVACSSGTTALTLALASLKIGEGDEVIVPEFTMIATAWAVSYLGATPVFVDCQYDMNIDPDKIEEKITAKTKAIIPVHIYGRQCDMDKINQIAYEYNLRVIEDSAEAHGIEITGDIACYSLFANKIITSGEGGICLTNDKHLAEQMKHLSGMAFDRDHTFLHKKLAYNFRMTNLQAAVALAQTERLDKILEKRKQIEKWYDKELKDIPEVESLERDVVWYYDIIAKNRDGLKEYLKEEGIETRVSFKPMSQQPMYFNEDYVHLKANVFAKVGLYLPTYNQLNYKDVKFICNKIKEYYAKE